MTGDGDGGSFDDITRGIEPTSEAKDAELDIQLRERLPSTIEKLTQKGVGRPIIIEKWVNKPHPDDIDRDNPVMISVKEAELVGCVLPLNEDNSKHLAVFNTGDMLVLEPDTVDNADAIRDYKNELALSTTPYTLRQQTASGAVELMRNRRAIFRTTLSNTDPDHTESFMQLFEDAIAVANKTKTRIENAKRNTLKQFLDRIDQTVLKESDETAEPKQAPSDQPPAGT